VELTTYTVFGERIVHGWSSLDIGGGLMPLVGDHMVPKVAIALYKLGKVLFVVVTKIGDTIHAETEVV
jgi:acyl dehydratase